MAIEKRSWMQRIRPYAIAFLVLLVLALFGMYLESTPWGQAKKQNTLESYESFIRANPDSSHVPEAEQRIRRLKYSFQPKFFVIYEGRDVSGEISVFEFDITRNEDEANTLAYVNAPASGESKVTVRLVDKKTKRERTIVASSTAPEWIRVTAFSGQVRSSGGGSHIIDGKTYVEAHNGQGILLRDILKYAQTLEGDK